MPTKAKTDPGTRRSVIVTFKPKDKRTDKQKDKLQIVQEAISSEVHFMNAAEISFDRIGPIAGLAHEVVGYDINLYEAPIVSLSLTGAEIERLSANSNVAAVEEDGLFFALPQALTFEGQPSPQAETVPVGVSQIKAPPAWDASRGKGIKVAILDTGIDALHPDLVPNVKGAVSFVPGETPADGNGHGTHCAGTIGAALTGSGVVGVAPAAWLYAVKVLSNSGSGNWSWFIAGVNWCIANKMNILNMSLGSAQNPGVAVEAICNAAFANGLLLVAAAGNAGPQMNSVGYPGKYKNVVAVSAIDSSNVIATFSSRGPEVELTAPGVNVLSTKPGGGFQTMSGTSMASPHIAGAAAVVWGAHRFATNMQIWNLLAASSDNLGVPGWDQLYGYGRPDVDKAATAMAPAPAFALKP